MLQYNNLITPGNDPSITKRLAYSQMLRNRKFRLVEQKKDKRDYYLGQYTTDPNNTITYIKQFTANTESNPDYKPTYIKQFDKELFIPGEPEPNNSRPIVLFHQYSAGQIWSK
tara:strand:+ start:6901 stop:7239 length:339 start_codon:yes stop_codon:yes gene_type:complete